MNECRKASNTCSQMGEKQGQYFLTEDGRKTRGTQQERIRGNLESRLPLLNPLQRPLLH